MRHHSLWTWVSVLAAVTFCGCGDESSGSKVEKTSNECSPACENGQKCENGKCADVVGPVKDECSPECQEGQTCVKGECVAGEKPVTDECSPECQEGQRCVKGECVKGEEPVTDVCEPACLDGQTCVEGECKGTGPVDDPCNGISCSDGKSCVNGKCLCGDTECTEGQVCSEGECAEPEKEDSACGSVTCVEGENCVDGKCYCGTEVCAEGTVCDGSKCVEAEDDTPAEDEEIPCSPECAENEWCNAGTCEANEKACDPECKDGEMCIDGKCQVVVDSCDNLCETGLTCVDSKCLCGTSACTDEQYCSDGKCKWTDSCHDVSCKSGETCVSGKCKSFGFTVDEMNVWLSSMSSSLVAKKSTTKKLTWSFGSNLKDWMIMCKVKSKNYKAVVKASDVNECIVYDNDKKTESVQFIGLSRHAKDLKVSVTDGTLTSDAILHLKPYFSLTGFVNLRGSGINAEKKIVYRNGYCPGNYFKGYVDESTDEIKANLGGDGNDYGRTSFSSEEARIFDDDLYEKYVKPNMRCDGGNCYGTRASVLAAARFLVLQFPYDIPYNMAPLNVVKDARSHYIWTEHGKKGNSLSEVAIYGLNLDSNAYNSQHKVIRENVVPWGAKYKPYDGESTEKKTKYTYNGLKCSGFVTWSFRNGRFGLGSWNSSMFAKQGYCMSDDNKTIRRNFRCKELVNNTAAPKSTVTGKTWSKSTSSNQNNELNAVYAKLNRLEDKDFVLLSPKPGVDHSVASNRQSQSAIQSKLNTLKAGDILWQGQCMNKNNETDKLCNYTKDGHVALIIGLKRDSNGNVTEIQVGEAVTRSGNRFNRYTVSQFMTTGWVKGTRSGGNYCNAYAIKMDNVYGYYDGKATKAVSKESDCTSGDKNGGNCYNYTESFKDAFENAIGQK